ncbi:copper chaperone PCu(A)C [Neorhizobium sp. DAR64872/K0K18]|uniref:copper chaperone PCu(A)C n=1 Tax=Neorhizobium sp. DAR64872/K0K18 TaxID=3421958 RepID=UPI003D278520
MKYLATLALCAAVLAAAADRSYAQAGDAGSGNGAMHMHGSSDPATASGASVKLGMLKISGGYVRAMLPGQPVGGCYLVIRNTGSENDRLVSASSPLSPAVEIHEMSMQGQIMKMRRLDGGISVPAGQTVELKPSGLHLMFTKVATPFKQGESVPLTLNFEHTGRLELSLPVEAFRPGNQHN